MPDPPEHHLTISEIDPDFDAEAPHLPIGNELHYVAAIASGGALGAVCRYLLGRALNPAGTGFAWGTLVANVTGAFALGVLATLWAERWAAPRMARPFFGVGFIGAFTTFSTLAVEADLMIHHHRPGLAGTYLGITVVAGLLATFSGVTVARVGTGRLVRPPTLTASHRANGISR